MRVHYPFVQRDKPSFLENLTEHLLWFLSQEHSVNSAA